ncbi:MAG: GyrI-like domain-containing protein [Actinobacteria bacterium]|nr:GyrI-like domain-containing protein [Actinomycetota bacterium]
MSEIDMSGLFDSHLPKVYDEISSRGYEIAGPPFARYHEFGPERADIEIGVPLTEAPSSSSPLDEVPLEQVGLSELPGGMIAKVVHHGPYQTLGDAYGPFHDWIHSQGHDEVSAHGSRTSLAHRGRPIQVWDSVVRSELTDRQIALFRNTQLILSPRPRSGEAG